MSRDYIPNTDYDDYTNDIGYLDNDYGCHWYVDNFILSKKEEKRFFVLDVEKEVK